VVRLRLVAITLAAFALTPALARATVSQIAAEPGATNVHYRSTLVHVTPTVPGVRWQVIDLNDEIMLTNRSRDTVTVFGYINDPYVRILPSGAVELNENSPAYYLNQSFYGNPDAVPASITTGFPTDWVTVAKTGTFVWHDHRIHYTSAALPPQVRSRGVGRTTLVEKWTVPFSVGARHGVLAGTLYWIAEKPFAFPPAAIAAFIVIVLGGAAFVLVVRRRRAAAADGRPAASW
jgi:hypothetical protein